MTLSFCSLPLIVSGEEAVVIEPKAKSTTADEVRTKSALLYYLSLGALLSKYYAWRPLLLDYWQFTTHYSLCFAYAKHPLIFVLFTGTSFVRFCFGFIQQKSLLICPANSLKFEQTFFRITWRSLHSCQNPLITYAERNVVEVIVTVDLVPRTGARGDVA